MDESIVRRLVALNKEFYERFAEPFSDSRSGPQPGYSRLLEYIPAGQPVVLDVGCGNGRFGRYLAERGITAQYTGVDFSDPLIDLVKGFPGRFVTRDLSRPESLSGLGAFDFIVCLSTLQHIPGRDNRLRLLTEMRAHLQPGGYLVLANWQFMTSERQRQKIVPWSTVGLDASDVEAGDYLLSWQRNGYGIRYVAYLNAATIEDMANSAGLRIAIQYRSDGREGSLNLYSILAG